VATVGLAVMAAVLVAVLVAVPAYAHTKATVDKPQAGATNVTLTLSAEAESSSAGIKGIEVVLPDGITPAQVSLVSGPPGWAFAARAHGFTVSGTALPVGKDATTALHLAALPATASVLVFKTLVNYGDGKVDRWIEEPTADNPDPADPAPTVSLKPAPGGAPAATNTSSPSAAAPTSNPADVQADPASGASSSSLPLIIAAVVVLLAVAGGLVVWRRRSAESSTTGDR
jgi:hypothetical protein